MVPFTVAAPSPARMSNAALRGKDNFPVGIEANQRIYEAVGERVVRATAFENDAFRQRATAYLAERCGIEQFIDVGCGLPVTKEMTTHAIAQRYCPSAAGRVPQRQRSFTFRTRHEAQAMVRGWDWLAPGPVPAALWEPDHKIPVDTGWIVGGAARKP